MELREEKEAMQELIDCRSEIHDCVLSGLSFGVVDTLNLRNSDAFKRFKRAQRDNKDVTGDYIKWVCDEVKAGNLSDLHVVASGEHEVTGEVIQVKARQLLNYCQEHNEDTKECTAGEKKMTGVLDELEALCDDVEVDPDPPADVKDNTPQTTTNKYYTSNYKESKEQLEEASERLTERLTALHATEKDEHEETVADKLYSSSDSSWEDITEVRRGATSGEHALRQKLQISDEEAIKWRAHASHLQDQVDKHKSEAKKHKDFTKRLQTDLSKIEHKNNKAHSKLLENTQRMCNEYQQKHSALLNKVVYPKSKLQSQLKQHLNSIADIHNSFRPN